MASLCTSKLAHVVGSPRSFQADKNKVRSQKSKTRFMVQASSSDDDSKSSSLFESMINGLTVAIQKSPLAEGKKRLAQLQAGDYDAAAIKSKVDAYIANNPVIIFSFSTCPFCKNAKALLDDMGVSYTAVELNQVEDGMAMRATLAEMTGRTSMPNIWIGGQGIGGCNDGPGIMTLNREGKLEEMLKSSGAL